MEDRGPESHRRRAENAVRSSVRPPSFGIILLNSRSKKFQLSELEPGMDSRSHVRPSKAALTNGRDAGTPRRSSRRPSSQSPVTACRTACACSRPGDLPARAALHLLPRRRWATASTWYLPLRWMSRPWRRVPGDGVAGLLFGRRQLKRIRSAALTRVLLRLTAARLGAEAGLVGSPAEEPDVGASLKHFAVNSQRPTGRVRPTSYGALRIFTHLVGGFLGSSTRRAVAGDVLYNRSTACTPASPAVAHRGARTSGVTTASSSRTGARYPKPRRLGRRGLDLTIPCPTPRRQ